MYGIFTYKTGWFLGQMLVNNPYMEHMGSTYTSKHLMRNIFQPWKSLTHITFSPCLWKSKWQDAHPSPHKGPNHASCASYVATWTCFCLKLGDTPKKWLASVNIQNKTGFWICECSSQKPYDKPRHLQGLRLWPSKPVINDFLTQHM